MHFSDDGYVLKTNVYAERVIIQLKIATIVVITGISAIYKLFIVSLNQTFLGILTMMVPQTKC